MLTVTLVVNLPVGSPRAEAPQAVTQDQSVTLSAEAQRNAALVTGRAETGTLATFIEAMGQVLPVSGQMVTIHPAGSGKVLTVDVVPGQHVRKNGVLITYQNHSLHVIRLQLAKAKAAVATAKAAQMESAAAYERARKLSGSSVAVGEVKRRQELYQAATDALTARLSDLATIRHELEEEYNSVTEDDDRSETSEDETSRLLSPVDGEVQSVSIGVADDISPTSTPVTIVDLSSVWIASDILPEDAMRVKPGGVQMVTPPDGDPGKPLVSSILSISSVADPATGLVRVLSRISNESGALRPGMMLTTHLEGREAFSGPVLPADAIVEIDGQSMVFLPAGKDGFRPVRVRASRESDGKVVILSGLTAGQEVVMHGAFDLKAVLIMSNAPPDND